ncbi:hypothetical protein [Longispora albida]|uniref:hypothetical protein n=1 Tax=Longispora albida TaxID=203523 RepID=UPI00037681F9|nr:hypothetical protein [Longispora albida]
MTAPEIAFSEPSRAGRHSGRRAARRQAATEGTLAHPPVPKFRSLTLSALAAGLTVLLLLAARLGDWVHAGVLLAVQFFYIRTWIAAARPQGWLFVAVPGAAVSVLASAGAVLWNEPSLIPIGYAIASGFLFAMFGQLARRKGREGLTDAFGAAVFLAVVVASYPVAIVLVRQDTGTRILAIGLLAAGAAVALARVADIVPIGPRLAPEVPRLLFGMLIGIAGGTGIAVLAGGLRTDLSVSRAALIGLLVAGAAILADLVACFHDADGPGGSDASSWLASARGPLLAFAVAIPVTYVAGVLILGAV